MDQQIEQSVHLLQRTCGTFSNLQYRLYERHGPVLQSDPPSSASAAAASAALGARTSTVPALVSEESAEMRAPVESPINVRGAHASKQSRGAEYGVAREKAEGVRRRARRRRELTGTPPRHGVCAIPFSTPPPARATRSRVTFFSPRGDIESTRPCS